MSHSAADWTNAIMLQMPRGDIWSRNQNSGVYKYAAGYAKRLQRAEASADQLRLEMRPETTQYLIDEWETYLDLPESTTVDQTFEERRNAVVEKYYRKGGLQPWAIEALAETLGYTVSVSEIFPHHCLRSCTYALYESRYRHIVQITVSDINESRASCLDACTTTLVSTSAALLISTLEQFKLAGKYYEYIYE